MVFQVTLVLYSCWVFLRLLRDPVSTFPWILPLVVVTRSLDLPVIGERLILFDLFLVLWFVLVALGYLAGHSRPALPREALLVLLLYGLFLGVNALSLLDARDPVGGGVALVVYSFGGLICLATLIAIQELGSIRPIVIAFCAVFVVVIFFAIAEIAGLSWVIEKSHPSRVTSTFRNPNQLGFFLTIVMPLVLPFLASRSADHKALRKLAFVSMLPSVLVAMSTASKLTFLIVILETGLLLLFALTWMGGRIWLKFLQIAIVSSLVVPSLLFLGIGQAHFARFQGRVLDWFQSLATSASVMDPSQALMKQSGGQFLLYNLVLPARTILTEPWLGVGAGNGMSTYQAQAGSFHEVHSQYFAVLGETGLFGLVTFLVFLGAAVFQVGLFMRENRVDRWMTLGLTIAFAACLLSGTYNYFLRRREFWIVLGIILACRHSLPGLLRVAAPRVSASS